MNESAGNKEDPVVIRKLQRKQRIIIVKELIKIPFVENACKKAGISRATYYRWRQTDLAFSDATDKARLHGRGALDDRVESILFKLILKEDIRAIGLYLRFLHGGVLQTSDITEDPSSPKWHNNPFGPRGVANVNDINAYFGMDTNGEPVDDD